MSGKLKLHWVTQDTKSTAVANALGYATHNNAMRKYGAEYFDFDENAKIALTITPADQFKPVPGKFNILFTMWECLDVPTSYIPGLKAADLVIVPSRFCYDIFRPLTDKPMEICPEGVEPDVFTFKERIKPDPNKGEKFRFLWLGAPNPRKGYYTIMEFVKIVEQLPDIELYIKTTAGKRLTLAKMMYGTLIRLRRMIFNSAKLYKWNVNFISEWNNIIASWNRYLHPKLDQEKYVYGRHKNIIFDARKIPLDELVALYHSAHCFLIPHCGEGWCLPLCEAMATGCPSVASYATSVTDFFDKEVGFPVRCDIRESDLQNYQMKARMYIPDTEDFVNQSLHVIKNYKDALARAKKASYRIRTQFTWKKAAKRLNDIVAAHYKEEA